MDNQDQSKNQEDFPRGDKENDPYSQNLPTLSDLLVGFQKTMARVAQDTARATKEDPLFLYGRRNLYYIDQLDVDTVVRITPDIDPEKLGGEWTLLQGQIDLLWPGEPGVWNILDYKSDRIKDEEDLTKRVQAYTLQINLYELAARKLWNAGTVRPYLYFVRSGRAVEVTPKGRA